MLNYVFYDNLLTQVVRVVLGSSHVSFMKVRNKTDCQDVITVVTRRIEYTSQTESMDLKVGLPIDEGKSEKLPENKFTTIRGPTTGIQQ